MNVQQSSSATFFFRGVALVVFLMPTFACRDGVVSAGRPAVSLDIPSDAQSRASVVVSGIAATDLQQLRAATLSRDQWTRILSVSVADGQAAVIGDYAVERAILRFTPMFPFDPGRQYHAVFDPSQIPGTGPAAGSSRIVTTIGLPGAERLPSTVVSAVYPSVEVVPENQLRMYLHFSAPMGLKGGLDYVHLIDARGQTVVDPFLPLDTEFWNDDRTRYTVFFDPGRQKRGITPNRQMGRSLVPGQHYTLVVDREWRDANGLPLKESFRREFRVGPADEQPLNTNAWRIDTPRAATRDALGVTFPEPLDHGLLLRALGIETSTGDRVDGERQIDPGEMRWRFTPADAWRAGAYQLIALGMLEDLAGNRIGRAFEVDRFDEADRSNEPQRTTIRFTVVAR